MVSGLRIAVGTATIIIICGVVCGLWAVGVADSYTLGFRTEFLSLALENSPIPLLFPLLSVIPFVLAAVPLVRNRFLVYTRPRRNVQRSLLRLYAGAAIVTFTTFAVTVGILAVVGEAASIKYNPGAVGYAENGLSTFSQLTAYGSATYYIFMSAWFGMNAAAYAVLGLSALLVFRNALIGLLSPWVLFTVVGFGMAVVGLETYSPYTVAPFNLIQLPLWMPLIPAGVLVVSAGASIFAVVRVAARLPVTG